MLKEEGYKLGGSIVYGIYVNNNGTYKLFDTVDKSDFDKIKKYADILSNSKNTTVIVVEYNAPDNIPNTISNDQNNIIYNTAVPVEIYDESYIKKYVPEYKEKNMSYTVKEIKDSLLDIFKEEKHKVISEKQAEDDFINVSMLIQRNKSIEPSNILLDYSDKKYGNEYVSEEIVEIIENNTGLELYNYTKLLREKDTKQFSKAAHEWVKKQVDKLYPKYIKDKQEAFGIAWDQWKSKHD